MADGLRIAICGGGFAGCAAASRLVTSNKVAKVHLFEMGVSVGGRSSTRVPRAGPPQCQFDHGLAYLTHFKAHGATKYPQHGGTPESDQILEQWIAKGWVARWNGSFVQADFNGGGVSVADIDAEQACRFVPVPKGSSVAEKYLVEAATTAEGKEPKLEVECGTRAVPLFLTETKKWRVRCFQTGRVLGDGNDFDWVLAADRLFFQIKGEEPRHMDPAYFETERVLHHVTKELNENLDSDPRIVCMLGLRPEADTSVSSTASKTLGLSAIHFEGHPVLGKAFRNTSKPGRPSDAGTEYWVVHGSGDWCVKKVEQLREELFQGVDGGNKQSFDLLRQACLRAGPDVLQPAFLDALRQIVETMTSTDGGAAANDLGLDHVTYSVGHRWGGAFPKILGRGAEHSGTCALETSPVLRLGDAQTLSYVDESINFGLCGDFFGSVTGSALAAAASGEDAASKIIGDGKGSA